MIVKIIFLCLATKLYCLIGPQTLYEFLNELNVNNLTEIETNVKQYEKEYMSLYMRATKKKEFLCDNMNKNIESLLEIKDKYLESSRLIDNGVLKNGDTRKFLEIRGDIEFGIRNIDIIVGRLNKTKVNCFNTSSQMEDYFDEIRKKNQKSKEELIQTVNKIIQFDGEL